jgi:hypothetical protein
MLETVVEREFIDKNEEAEHLKKILCSANEPFRQIVRTAGGWMCVLDFGHHAEGSIFSHQPQN